MTDAIGNLTIHVLREIRDEIISTRTDLRTELRTGLREVGERIEATNERLDVTNERLDVTNQRLGAVESTLLELASQQRFVGAANVCSPSAIDGSRTTSRSCGPGSTR